MPWHIKNNCVYKEGSKEPLHCYKNEADAKKYLAALYVNEHKVRMMTALDRASFSEIFAKVKAFFRLMPKDEVNPDVIANERWTLGPEGEKKHCPKCMEFSGMGWRPLGFYPMQRAKTTYCTENCQCKMEYSDGQDYSEIERIADWKQWEHWNEMISRTQTQINFFPLCDCGQERGTYPWDKCIEEQTAKYGAESAKKICGSIKAKYGKRGDAMIQFFPTIEEAKGNWGHKGRPEQVGWSAPSGGNGGYSVAKSIETELSKAGITASTLNKVLDNPAASGFYGKHNPLSAEREPAYALTPKSIKFLTVIKDVLSPEANDIASFALKQNEITSMEMEELVDELMNSQYGVRNKNRLATDEATLALCLSLIENEKASKKPVLRIRQDPVTKKYRWFAWPACTAFMNRDKQIDSMKLFDNFIERIKQSHIWPFLTFFHLGSNFRMGEADFVARDGAAYLVSGLFDDTKLARAAIKSLSEDTKKFWGVSIQYTPLGEPKMLQRGKEQIPVYEDGNHVEISILPEQAASSLYTAIPVTPTIERSKSMNQLVRTALHKLIGDDEKFRTELEGMIDEVNRAATDPEAIVRETTEVAPPENVERKDPPTDAPPTEAPPAEATSKFTPEDLNEIANALLGNPDFLKALGEAIKNEPPAEPEAPPAPEPATKATEAAMKPELEQMFRTQDEKLSKLGDAIETLAASLLVQEADTSKRARNNPDAPISIDASQLRGSKKTSKLELAAASVLSKLDTSH